MSVWTCFGQLLLEVRRSFPKVYLSEWAAFGEKCQQQSKSILSACWQHFRSALDLSSVSLQLLR